MKKTILILFLIASKFTFAQIKNSSFEIWDSVYTNVYSSTLDTAFGVPNPVGGIINSWSYGDYGFGISRTTDSHSGNYSLILHNWYNYPQQQINYSDTLSYRPHYLQGYFKYITGGINGIAQGIGTVSLTRFNSTSNDTIATGGYLFDSTNIYRPFQIAFNYQSALNPDSIHIKFKNAGQDQYCKSMMYMVCNLLYLDAMTLSDTPLNTENLDEKNIVRVYPNPTDNEVTIENNLNESCLFYLYNSLGEKVTEKVLLSRTGKINLSGYIAGIYFFKLIGNNDIRIGKIIKQ